MIVSTEEFNGVKGVRSHGALRAQPRVAVLRPSQQQEWLHVILLKYLVQGNIGG